METSESGTSSPERLCVLAQHLAEQLPDFFAAKGPGHGNRATGQFLDHLRQLACGYFGADFSERAACGSTGFRFDFYFSAVGVAVEFALGLYNPNSEFERDIFKCLLAQDEGYRVDRLVLMGKPGTIARLAAPGPQAIKRFVKRRFGLEVDVLEFQYPGKQR